MKKVLILSLALILLLGMANYGTFAYFSDTETSTGNTFTAWVEEVVCTCEKFNVSDKPDAKIYKYDDTGAFAGSFDLHADNGFPRGVAAAGDYVYVLDQADKQVYRYSCCGGTPVVSKKLLKQTPPTASIGNPDGLAIDGNDMWVVVWGPNFIIYHYSLTAAFPDGGDLPADLEIAPHADNDDPTGLAIDATLGYLYVLDSVDKQIYRYPHPSGPHAGDPVVASKVLKEQGGGDLDSPAGAMVDGTSLWVVDSGTNKMYEYDITDLFDGIGSTVDAIDEFDLDINNSDASGV